MDHLRLGTLAVLLVAALSGCAEKAPETVAEALVPAMLAVKTEVQMFVRPSVQLTPEEYPDSLPQSVAPPEDPAVDLATALIIRWEVTSQSVYTRKYQGIICPPGQSGPTWGIGYDGGHQTRLDIAQVWRLHPQRDDLLVTSGQIGPKCRPIKVAMPHIRTSYTLASDVFSHSSLPAYCLAARRAYGPAYEDASPGVRAALCSLTYNRGGSMMGSRNDEKREIRDTCLPSGDRACTASQLRKMCRLWTDQASGKGLCARRFDEAATAERGSGQGY